MAESSFLRNPGRTIHAGVFLVGGVTELIDVMPMDLLHGMNKKFLGDFAEVFGKEAVDQALDIEFHWVNETGKTAKLTTNITMKATVSSSPGRLPSTTDTIDIGLVRDMSSIGYCFTRRSQFHSVQAE
jgi:hypothetical protein